ncbi:Vacuolar protein sorting-associated protein 41 [Thecaphora frezii]
MSSPEDALALTRDLEQRQATNPFPTLATRSSTKRDRPSISSRISDSQHRHQFANHATSSSAPPQLASEPDPEHPAPNVDAELRAFLDEQNEDIDTAHHHDALEDSVAGELEMNYAPPSTGKDRGSSSASPAADATAAEAGKCSSSGAAALSPSKSASETLSAAPPNRRALNRTGSSAVSVSRKRMTVLMDGEMPEDEAVDASEGELDEEDEEEEDEEDEEEDNGDTDEEEDAPSAGAGVDQGASHPYGHRSKSISKHPVNGKGRPACVDNRASEHYGRHGTGNNGAGDASNSDATDDEGEEDEEDEEEEDEEDNGEDETEEEDEVSEEGAEDEDEEASGEEDDDDDGEEEEEEEKEEKEEEEEEDDEDTSDEETEPSLKYSRVKGSATDILSKDSASAFAVSPRFMALGTHGGMVYILDVEGNLIKGFRSHTASILDIDIDSTCEFVASASMDGMVSVSALSTSEQYVFDFKRPMRCIALEPNFGRKSTRALVCGGMAGALVQREKSWFGHKEVVLHAGEGPIYTTKWRSNLIAWANDRGVRIYDTNVHQRISFISAPAANIRADLYRCSLYWQDDRTLLVAWADHIKIAKVKERRPAQTLGPSLGPLGSQQPQLYVEITAIFKLDCMISGIAPYGLDYLVLAYITEEVYQGDGVAVEDDPDAHRRREALRPELRIISRAGEELSSDVLSLNNFSRFQCNDYLLVPSEEARAYSAAVMTNRRVRSEPEASTYYVVSPKDIVVSRPRDERDHVEWLLERKKYEAALVKVEAMGKRTAKERGFDAEEIGKKYLNWLVEEDRYDQAAKVASKILGRNVQAWEDWIFLFVEKGKLGTAIPFIPTSDPTLSGLVYDMILAHFLQTDPEMLLSTIREWPPEIYSTQAVVIAIEDRLSREKSNTLLMECLAELFIRNRQPSKALPYFLRLRRPNVFDLIRENNLFTAVQDQALLLIEFEEDIRAKGKDDTGEKAESVAPTSKHGAAIELLVDHTHSIPIHRVIKQLESHPRYLYMYLDSLFDRDPQQVSSLSDLQVKLYADYEYPKLMAYLRAMSSFYSFEKAFNICKEHDYVPEMVFLLGRVGDNKRALSLIIERLGDVERAIDFAKEQNDDDLWEDLLRYSETKPAFIRGLLENVGAEIDPIRLIRRIKNGLEIPGLKSALIKILHDFSLQVSLLEGCDAILNHDNRLLSSELQRGQEHAHYCDSDTRCVGCQLPLLAAAAVTSNNAAPPPAAAAATSAFAASDRIIFFLCGHAHHLGCLVPPAHIPALPVRTVPLHLKATSTQAFAASLSVRQRWSQFGSLADGSAPAAADTMDLAGYGPQRRAEEANLAFEERLRYDSRLRVLLRKGCPTCRKERMLASELAV